MLLLEEEDVMQTQQADEDEFTVWLWRDREDLLTWSSKLVEIGSGPRSTTMKLLGRIGRAVDLKEDTTLMVFRRHIVPMWEDPGNIDGGRWRMDVNVNHLTRVFIKSVFALFSDPRMAHASGVFLKRRRGGGRIDLWCGVSDEAVVREIGLAWHRIVELVEGRMMFHVHNSSNWDSLIIRW